MADQAISTIITEEAFAQVERLKGQLNDSVRLFEANVKSAVNLNSALKNADGAKELTKVLQQQDKIMSDLKVSQDVVLRSNAEYEKAVKRSADMIAQYNGHSKEFSQVLLNQMKISTQSAKVALEEARVKKVEAEARLLNAKAADIETKSVERAEKAKAKANQKRTDFIPLTPADAVMPDYTSNPNNYATEADRAKEAAQLDAATASYTGHTKAVIDDSAAVTANTAATGAAMTGEVELTALLREEEAVLAALKNEQTILRAEKKAAGTVTGEIVGKEMLLNNEIKDQTLLVNSLNKQLTSESGSLAELEAKLTVLTISYKRLSDEQKNSPIGAYMQTELKKTTDAVKAANAEIGNHTKNVGNYSNSITKAMGGVWSSIRQIAYILPGIGVAGIIGLISDAIVDVVKNMDIFKTKLTDLQQIQKLDNDVRDKAIDGYIKQKVEMDHLTSRMNQSSLTTKDQKTLLAEYNETFGESIGKAHSFTEAHDLIIQRGPAFIASLRERSMALAGLGLATEAAKEGMQNSIKSAEDFLDPVMKASLAVERRLGNRKNIIESIIGVGQAKQLDEVSESFKKYNQLLGLVDKHEEQQKKEEGGLTFNYGGKPIKEAKKNLDSLIEAERKAQEEILRIRTQAQIDFNKIAYEGSGRESYRVKAMQIELDLEDAMYAKELEKKKLTDGQKELLELQHEKKRSDIRTNFIIDIQNYNDKQKESFKKMQEEMTAIGAAEDVKRSQQMLDDFERQTKAQVSVFEKQMNAEHAANLKNYTSGLVGREQYEKNKKDIQDKYEEQGLQDAIKANFDLLKIIGDNPDKEKVVFDKIELLQKQHEDKKTKIAEDGEQKREDDRKKRQRALVETLQFIQSQIQNIVQTDFDNQMTMLENKSKAVDDAKQKELDALDQTSLSEQEKAKQQKLINAEAEAQQRDIQAREIQLKQKKAKFDKAMSITQTVAAGAQAVAVALTAGPIVGIVLAALVGALVAVQVAKIIAQPLPQYKMGRKDGPGEMALVGEAGMERVEHPDGASYYVNKPTITYLPEHAKVVPSFELSRERLNKAALSTVFVTPGGNLVDRSVTDNKEVVSAIKENTQAINNSKTSIHVHRSWQGEKFSVQNVQGYTKWINDNIG